jgi:hypothetical protein
MNIEIDEGQRQMILLALAHLAVERPGWKAALADTALVMDDGTMFRTFYQLRHDVVRDSLPENPTAETLNTALAKFDTHENIPV